MDDGLWVRELVGGWMGMCGWFAGDWVSERVFGVYVCSVFVCTYDMIFVCGGGGADLFFREIALCSVSL